MAAVGRPMTNQHRICPVCHRPVTRTRENNIAGHTDQAGRPCPTSFELSYSKAITVTHGPRK
jgi:hypothetical protein